MKHTTGASKQSYHLSKKYRSRLPWLLKGVGTDVARKFRCMGNCQEIKRMEKMGGKANHRSFATICNKNNARRKGVGAC